MSTAAAQHRPVAVYPIHKIVASEIRAWKARLQVTQEELAELLDVSQQGISRRLNGHTPFTLDELGVIAAFFRVPPATFLDAVAPDPLPRMDSNHQPAGYRRLELVA